MKKQAKPILRQLLKNHRKYGMMLFIKDAVFKAYRYSDDSCLREMDKLVGDDEELFYEVIELYKRFYDYWTYLKEEAPQWKTVEVVPFADNSIEEKQVDKHGNVRWVMVKAPSGDIC